MKRTAKRKQGMTVEERACTSKVRHLTEPMARMAAKKRIWDRRGEVDRMWVYPCVFCDGWHTTSRLSGHGDAVEA